jgi:PLP dependent protein
VDSLTLLGHLDRLAGERDLKVSVLVQLNISREPQKHGIDPERLPEFLRAASAAGNVEVLGLMGMGPFADDPEVCRPLFRDLRGRLEDANVRCSYRAPMRELSMGMTNDYEIAVEEGATLLRVGTALFSGVESMSPASAPREVEER